MRGVFVTGTGTEVGKTMVAAAIARTAASEGKSVAVFKPAVTGLDELDEPDPREPGPREPDPREHDHHLLRRAAGSEQSDDEIAPYRFGPAVSPHLAAQMAGERIDTDAVLAAARAAAEGSDLLVCEGVGGFLVPLTPDYLVRDLARQLAMPVVIAAPPGLGTISHSLLTLEAVRAAGLEAAAVVLTPWPGDPSELERSNRATIASIGEVAVLTLPQLEPASPERWPRLDPLS